MRRSELNCWLPALIVGALVGMGLKGLAAEAPGPNLALGEKAARWILSKEHPDPSGGCDWPSHEGLTLEERASLSCGNAGALLFLHALALKTTDQRYCRHAIVAFDSWLNMSP